MIGDKLDDDDVRYIADAIKATGMSARAKRRAIGSVARRLDIPWEDAQARRFAGLASMDADPAHASRRSDGSYDVKVNAAISGTLQLDAPDVVAERFKIDAETGRIGEGVRKALAEFGASRADIEELVKMVSLVTAGGLSGFERVFTHPDKPDPLKFSFTHADSTTGSRCRLAILKMAEAPPYKIGKVSESAAHRLADAWRDHAVQVPFDTTGRLATHVNAAHAEDGAALTSDPMCQIFLVQHDWFAALDTATDFGAGEFRVPADEAIFEGRVNGLRFLADCSTDEGGQITAMMFFEAAGAWALLGAYGLLPDGRMVSDTVPGKPERPFTAAIQGVVDYIGRQIRAISIALDADIATTTVTRAPHKLNREREKRGRAPLNDFHIVDLSRRRRLAPAEDHVPVAGSPRRWHYVRGHWRHYESHKTWIKPHFRGDIDLGIIDKHYRL